MQAKRILIIGLLVAIIGVSAASAKVAPMSKIIDRLTGQTEGGWVKIDLDTTTPSYERVYCVKVDGSIDCLERTLRTVPVTAISKGSKISKR